jgi:hypothetical protein
MQNNWYTKQSYARKYSNYTADERIQEIYVGNDRNASIIVNNTS